MIILAVTEVIDCCCLQFWFCVYREAPDPRKMWRRWVIRQMKSTLLLRYPMLTNCRTPSGLEPAV